jgi:hypothetical protein
MSAVAERVARGAALLDEKMPGWIERVNVEWLDIASCYFCVLGQVLDDGTRASTDDLDSPYSAGIKALDIDREYHGTVWHGFDGIHIDALNAAWRRLVADRQAALAAA